jgi:hypothetical protein
MGNDADDILLDWKPTITVYKKRKEYKPDIDKISTKQCPTCGNEQLLLIRTLNLKACTDCYKNIPWYLEDGQQPIQ